MTFEKEFEQIESEEYDRQRHHLQNLQRADFFSPSYRYISYEEKEELFNKLPKESIASSQSNTEDQLIIEKNLSESDQSTEDFGEIIPTNANTKAIDIINQKISKLDSFFSTVKEVKAIGRPSSYEPILDEKAREQMALNKEREQKQLNLFAGIYTMKSVIYNKKSIISPPPILKHLMEDVEVKKAPKLVELYQYPGFDSLDKNKLPHDVNLKEVQRKVINSILILNRQPSYKEFLTKIYYSESCRQLISDAFWYCFLERYQKLPVVQQELFRRISDNYVKLIFSDMDFRYRDTFLTKFADLLAQSVYGIFVTCFPESYMSQFTDEFREFICQLLHTWISGCKPTPRTFDRWNLSKLDPAAAVFAKEVLNKKDTLEDTLGLGTLGTGNISNLTHTNNDSSMKSKFSSLSRSRNPSHNVSNLSMKKNAYSASLVPSRRELLPSVLSEITSTKSARTVRDIQTVAKHNIPVYPVDPSHPVGSSHIIEETLFDIYGHSPLVEFYLYNQNARKINTSETLIQHQFVKSLPPLNAPTYRDEIKASRNRIKELENELKTVQTRQKTEINKMKMERINYMREFKQNQELLFNNPKEVKVMGELIAMNIKRDPTSTSFNMEAALMKAFKNSIKSKN